MPTYEYKCTICNYHFEAFQSIKDSPLGQCPDCKRDSLKRIISGGAGLIFRGEGFYITDYKKNNNKKLESKKEKPKETESKPADKRQHKKK